MILHLIHPVEKKISMSLKRFGYFTAEVEGVNPGNKYFFQPDGEKDFPDPASQYQPLGVHGPSEIIDHNSFKWNDREWKGIPFKDLIFYEIHVGVFTPDGTFEAIIPFLNDIAATGINAIELMPVTQFPGSRNWGYDGVYPYAVQNSYGGPDGLKKLVNACHIYGIAVFLDIVYNHLGPEGNYLGRYGPYFTNRHKVIWGEAINYDGDWSDGAREYFSNNTLYWFENYHIDGLRLDAIHMVFDTGAVNFWELTNSKISEFEQKLGRQFYMIAESDLNSPRVIKPFELGGFGFDALWLDDFHHALYVLIHKPGKERYEDFGRIEQLVKAYTDGFVHSGEFVKFRKRKFGASSAGIPGDKFIVFNQNHDQIGNRVKGERLSTLVDFNRLKLAAAAMLLSPYVPLLFMGEEYGEDTPFYYFISHSDEGLIKTIQEGRKKEFEKFNWKTHPPFPQDEKTFIDSKIKWDKRSKGKYKILLQWNKELISMRRCFPALQNFNKSDIRAYPVDDKGFMLHRKSENGQQQILCIFNLSENKITYQLPSYTDAWIKLLDSNEQKWQEPETQQNNSALPVETHSNEVIALTGCQVAVYRNIT